MILKSCSKAWRTWQPHVVWDRAVAADRVLGLRCLRRCVSRWAKRDVVHAAAGARGPRSRRAWEDAGVVRRCCLYLQETPRPRLPGLGGPRHASIEEGGRYRTFDAAGHRDSKKWRRRHLAKGLRAWRGFVQECTALERKFGIVVRAPKGAAAVGRRDG